MLQTFTVMQQEAYTFERETLRNTCWINSFSKILTLSDFLKFAVDFTQKKKNRRKKAAKEDAKDKPPADEKPIRQKLTLRSRSAKRERPQDRADDDQPERQAQPPLPYGPVEKVKLTYVDANQQFINSVPKKYPDQGKWRDYCWYWN